MNAKVRWGVLGAAEIAVRKVIPAIQRGECSQVVAIASRDLERASSAAAKLGISKSYGSYEELLADPDIEAVYATGDHPRVYYVEAARRYRRLGQGPDECEAVAFGAGWFVRDGTEVRSLETVVDLLECSRAGAGYMLPLGVMRIAGKTFWLAQFSGWAHERFVVVEIKPKAVEAVLSVWGGSCRS